MCAMHVSRRDTRMDFGRDLANFGGRPVSIQCAFELSEQRSALDQHIYRTRNTPNTLQSDKQCISHLLGTSAPLYAPLHLLNSLNGICF